MCMYPFTIFANSKRFTDTPFFCGEFKLPQARSYRDRPRDCDSMEIVQVKFN